MFTCRCKGGTNHLSQVIRPRPKESWEYVRVGLRHMSGLTLQFLGAGPGWGLTTFITKPCVFSLRVIMGTFYQKYSFCDEI